MANKVHLEKLLQGVATWNHWREQHPNTKPDLSGAFLTRASLHFHGMELPAVDLKGLRGMDGNLSLRGANLRGADLHGAVLIGADAVGTDLRNAILDFAALEDVDLRGSDLRGAQLRSANLSGTNLHLADLSAVDLQGADLSRSFMIKTNLDGANLAGCRVFGISAWNVSTNQATEQRGLILSAPDEPELRVDDIEVAQFIHLLLRNDKIRSVIDTITSKVVLILGRFTPERKPVLDAIQQELRRRNCVPVMFDFNKPGTRDTHETITTLARMARFVIADITDPKSIPQEMTSIVEQLPSLPVQPILQQGSQPWGMYDHIRRYPWVLPIQRYASAEELLPRLSEQVITPAEAKLVELRRQA